VIGNVIPAMGWDGREVAAILSEQKASAY
jgi:hypothetical protein